MKRAAAALVLLIGCGTTRADFPGDIASAEPVVPVDDPDAKCGTLSAASLAKCIEPERIGRDISVIAKPRPPASEQHASVQSMCAERLAGLGFAVERMSYGTGVNVIGIKLGFSKSNEHVIVAAHYDHLPDCAGADDNASGVAVVLETARVLSAARFDRSLVVACWDEAERGQLGSAAYALRAKERDEHVVVAMTYEAVGFASNERDSQKVPEGFERFFPDQALALLDNDSRGDFLMIVTEAGSVDWATTVSTHARHDGLPVQMLRLSDNQKRRSQESIGVSDHVSFWRHDIPAMLFTDSGKHRNPRVHCESGPDDADTIDTPFAAAVARSALAGVVDALDLR